VVLWRRKWSFHDTEKGLTLSQRSDFGIVSFMHTGTPVNLVGKYRGFAIAPAHDVVNGACVLDPKFYGQEGSIIDSAKPSIHRY